MKKGLSIFGGATLLATTGLGLYLSERIMHITKK